ncbi:calcium-binding protein [Acuticoccus sediminis]|nr:hypothetical protein [Acuticoccus sediminis]
MLLGLDITVELFKDDPDNVVAGPFPSTVTSGVEFPNVGAVGSLDIADSTATYTVIEDESGNFDDGPFNGGILNIPEFESPKGLTLNDVSIITGRTTLDVSESDAYVTKSSLFLDLSGIEYAPGDSVSVRLGFNIAGTGDADELKGDFGNDRLFGMKGDDDLFGDIGDDVLVGGLGDDVLDGGRGNDRLFGDEGSDTFVFRDQGVDRILDWETGVDTILVETGATSFDDFDLYQRANGVAIADDNARMFVAGVTVDEVDASWFAF